MRKTFRNIWQRIVRCFIGGALAILPLVITGAVVIWVAGFVSGFVGPDTVLGEQLNELGLKLVSEQPAIVSYAVGWIVVLAAILALGVFLELGARRFVERTLEAIVSRIPLLGSLYTASKQVVGMMDKRDDDVLKGMVPVFCVFGKENGAGVLALLVSPTTYTINGADYQIVVVPTAPIPFGGGLFFVPVHCVHTADMSVDGLMSIYVSMGVSAGDYFPDSKGGGDPEAEA